MGIRDVFYIFSTVTWLLWMALMMLSPRMSHDCPAGSVAIPIPDQGYFCVVGTKWKMQH